jgi:hypothetical protein
MLKNTKYLQLLPFMPSLNYFSTYLCATYTTPDESTQIPLYTYMLLICLLNATRANLNYTGIERTAQT